MMKTLIKAALAATVATGLLATPALAANSATAPFTAKATILKPLTLSKAKDLDFGTIAMGPALTSSTVVLDRADGLTCGTNLTCTGTPTSARFDVTGVALQNLNVTLGAVATLSDGAGNTVGFSADSPTSITLDGSGLRTFGIGGTITVLAGTKDGVYSAPVPVTVTYQ